MNKSWSILEIRPTKNKKEIRRAYTRLLKKYHPEDNPDGFMKLRAAYEQATKWAEQLDKTPFNNTHSALFGSEAGFITKEEQTVITDEVEEEEPIVITDEASETEPPLIITDEVEISGFYEEMRAIYEDIFKRRDINSWKSLFLHQSLVDSERLSEIAIQFVIENPHLPHDIWLYLDSELSLSKRSWFPWKDMIQYDLGLTFQYLDPNLAVDYEKYADLRFQAFLAIRDMKYLEGIDYAMQAMEIYNRDPVLYKLLGVSYYVVGDYDRIEITFSRVLKFIPNDVDALVYRGYAYYQNGDYENAKQDFNQALSRDQDNMEARRGLGLILKEIKARNQTVEDKCFDHLYAMDLELDYSKCSESMFFFPDLPEKENYLTFIRRNFPLLFQIIVFSGMLLFLITMIYTMIFEMGDVLLSMVLIVVLIIGVIKVVLLVNQLER